MKMSNETEAHKSYFDIVRSFVSLFVRFERTFSILTELLRLKKEKCVERNVYLKTFFPDYGGRVREFYL